MIDKPGEVAEWSIASDLKSDEPLRVPGVRISPSPYHNCSQRQIRSRRNPHQESAQPRKDKLWDTHFPPGDESQT